MLRGIFIGRIIISVLIVVAPALFPDWTRARLVPAPLVHWVDQGPEHAVLVDKSAQKVYVFHRADPSKPLKVYPCSTGEHSGPKTKKNDRKTPEGVYFFVKSYVKRDLAPIYGVRAFPIDYPNPFDRREGNGGYGIWFHGTNKPLKPRDTNGCIVLENGSIEDLASYIRLRETPAIISSSIEFVPHEQVKRNSTSAMEMIERWRISWQEKDLDAYMGLYSRRFFSRGMDRERWRRYKTRLARKYDKIRVEVEKLQLFETNGSLLAKFYQTYRATGLESRGHKILYLAREGDGYRIISEVFKEDRRARKARVARPSVSLEEIKVFVETWRGAWERKDLESYVQAYDSAFHSSGMDLEQWRRYKDRLNGKYASLKIHISELRIIGHSGRFARVRFMQDYMADTYHDKGVKDLFLVKRGRQWKIKKETWSPLTSKAVR